MVAQQPPNLLGVGANPTERVSLASWREWFRHSPHKGAYVGSNPIGAMFTEFK